MATRTDAQTRDWIEDYRAYHRLTPIDPAQLEDLIDYIGDTGREPTQYVTGLFDQHDIVFLGHRTPTLQTGLFLQDLILALHSAGIWAVGIEWACVDDQPLLDALLRGPAFDEALARGALFRWGLRHHFAYEEYLNVLRAAWTANQRRDAKAPHFRVVALDYDIDIEAVTDTADLRSPWAWPHLRPYGSAARHMADVILREFVDPGQKALILTRTEHALTRLRRTPHPVVDQIDCELSDGKAVGAANHVFSAIADRAATVLIQQSIPADGTQGEYAFPADGLLDAAFAHDAGPKYPVGFDIDNTALGQLPCSSSLDGGVLSDWAQGWVFLHHLDRAIAPTPIDDVVNDSNLEHARRWALDSHLRRSDVTAADFNTAIATSAALAELDWAHLA